jgi:NAD+ kinase
MNLSMRKIGIIPKKQDARVRDVVDDVVSWLQSRDVEVYLDRDSGVRCSANPSVVESDEMIRQVDVILVLGGDGTLLHAARLVGAAGIPMLGVNLGSLGFLTEVKLDDIYSALEGLLSGQYQSEERVLLNVEVIREGKTEVQYLALNDAVINKGALARIIDLEVSVNSQTVLSMRADGLIVSTPTGSTAYSLAAGGPIIYPTLEAFIVAPICPHTLTNRPVVIPDRDEVEVCLQRGTDVMLTVDGQVGMPLKQNDCVKICRAQSTLKLVLPFGSTFFKLLREKLRWG